MSEKTFARLSCTEIIDRLQGGVDTLVIAHVRPDADALGSAFAVKAILEAMGCRAFCVCADEIPARLRFLVGDAQESILPEHLPADFVPSQIITVDTAAPAQMGSLFDLYGHRVGLMIDHHGRGEMYADGWVDGTMAAAGEMVYELSRALVAAGKLTAVPDGVDRWLYAAISADTGCFAYSNVTPQTHLRAAELLGTAADGAFDPSDINHRLFKVKSPGLLLAERLAFDRLQLFADRRLGIVDMPLTVKEAHGLADEHLETMVEIPRSMEGVEVAVAIRQSDEATYRVSMRSSTTSEVDVAAVCAGFGGGGHACAAGCTVICSEGMATVIATVADAVSAAMPVSRG